MAPGMGGAAHMCAPPDAMKYGAADAATPFSAAAAAPAAAARAAPAPPPAATLPAARKAAAAPSARCDDCAALGRGHAGCAPAEGADGGECTPLAELLPPGAAAPAPPVTLRTPLLPAGARGVLGLYGAARAACGSPAGIRDVAARLIAQWGLEETLYVYDLGEVARLHAIWTAALPRVHPFYAVKCNPEPGLLAMLDALGCGFDCASVQELEAAAALGVPQDRLIFANPMKRPADLRFAAARGVETTTFDNACELHKIAAVYPSVQLVLRIRCDDPTSHINLGLKYGAEMEDVPALLALARDLGLQVVGVSFHVGSGCKDVSIYAEAIRRARAAFDAAADLGFGGMRLLDVGGGFTAPHDPASAELFVATVDAINGALDAHFPDGCGVRVIAEPGRFFAETAATLVTAVLGAAPGGGAGAPAQYYLSDGTSGSFRIQVAVDGLEPACSLLRSPLLPAHDPRLDAPAPCRLLGDSGRAGDCVHGAALLPAPRPGDWLVFPAAGAYTICSSGTPAAPIKLFVCSDAAQRDLGAPRAAAARIASGFVPPGAAAAKAPAPLPRGLLARRAGDSGDSSGAACAALAAADLLRGLSVACPGSVPAARGDCAPCGSDDSMSSASDGTAAGASPRSQFVG